MSAGSLYGSTSSKLMDLLGLLSCLEVVGVGSSVMPNGGGVESSGEVLLVANC